MYQIQIQNNIIVASACENICHCQLNLILSHNSGMVIALILSGFYDTLNLFDQWSV